MWACEKSPAGLKQYEELSPLAEISQSIIQKFFLDTKPFVSRMSNLKRSLKMAKMIAAEGNDKSMMIKNLGCTVDTLRTCSRSFDASTTKELINTFFAFLEKNGVRSLVGKNLRDLFSVMEKYAVSRETVLMNMAANLMTVYRRPLYVDPNEEQERDQMIDTTNAEIDRLNKLDRRLIFDQYCNVWKSHPKLFEKGGLAPLSMIIADIFEELS